MGFASICIALLLDALLKEPARFHPLVGFGRWAAYIETKLNSSNATRITGIAAYLCVVLPVLFIIYVLLELFKAYELAIVVISGAVLYVCIGWQSLLSHAKAVEAPLQHGDLSAAKHEVSKIISRDTSEMKEKDVASAATESVLENGADAIFAAIFWFVVLGPVGAVLYRLSNTLDAMWGYKTERYRHYGWAAARMDDVLNYIPARLTALAYACAGNYARAMAAWRAQGATWKSPNAGVVMSAGAGAINTALGGGAHYHGKWEDRPCLGPEDGHLPSAASIRQACALVNRALVLWAVVIGLMAVVFAACSVPLPLIAL